LESFDKKTFKKVEGESVGIIGSGPAGLAAAHDLALMGFSVVIYEMEPVPAGMLYLGIPSYRLPRKLIESEIDALKSLDVKIITNCTVGKDISLKDIRKRHQAVIIAVGCKKSRSLPLPGADVKGVLGGVEFLRDVALDLPHEIGKKVVVIGGGNVAYDIARTALRRLQMDVAQTALLEKEGINVTLCCIEREDEMLADEIEILEGEQEGVIRQTGYGPQEILAENHRVTGVLFHRVISIFDENGQFNPQYDSQDTLTLEADAVLFAIGQQSDLSFLDQEMEAIKIDERGNIVCDPDTLRTTAERVFLAGDLASGPGLMIDAIASGKKVARSVYQEVTGQNLSFETLYYHTPIEDYTREIGYEKVRRERLETVAVPDRILAHDVILEKGYTGDQARVEGSRCFDCSVNTIFDGNKCILCGGCAEICPEHCLKLVAVADLEGDKTFDELVNCMKKRKESNELTAIIKDEERCIRCGLCAFRCPVDAITMERFSFREVFS